MDPSVQQTTCDGACTVTLVVDSAPITEERAGDLLTIFWAFVLAAVTVWGVKALLRLFTHDTND